MTAPYASTSLPAPQPVAKSKTLAVLALVFGIVSLALSFIPIINNVGIVLGVAGVIIGIIGLFKSARGMSIAGLLCGIAGVVIGLVLQMQWAAQLDQIGHQLDSGTVSTGPTNK